MGRPPIDKKSTKNTARIHMVAPASILRRISRVLQNGETQSDFIRQAVEALLKRRERKPSLSGEKGKKK